jgi:hypothetical protein
MTSQTSRNTGWRRAVTGALASGALAAGLMAGLGSGTANADVLDDIYSQYNTGAGGGQVSNLIHTAMKLRSLGFGPSKGNMEDLQVGMDSRPNQVPLINALQSTVAFMKREQARSTPSSNPNTIGVNQYNPSSTPGLFAPGAGGGINIPLGP